MPRSRSGFSFLIGIAVSASASAASAQTLDFGSTFYIGSTTMNMSNIHADAVNDQVESVVSDPQGEAAMPPTSVDLSFISSPKRSKANLAYFVSQVRAKNADEADNLEQMFSSVDVIGLTGEAMRGVGLDPQNLADVYAIWWVIAWSAANGVESTNDASTYRAVQEQARAAFANLAGFSAASEADRQQFAETLMVQAGILDSANDEARGNAANSKIVAEAARRGAGEMGLNLDTMVLTREGFRPRDGAALGQQQPGGGEGSSLPTYLAIAAAAGAGFGAVYLMGRVASHRG